MLILTAMLCRYAALIRGVDMLPMPMDYALMRLMLRLMRERGG